MNPWTWAKYSAFVWARSVVSVRTALVGFKEKSIQFVHEMIDDDKGDIVAKTVLKGVHLDTELRKSCPFPEAIAAKMASLVMELPAS